MDDLLVLFLFIIIGALYHVQRYVATHDTDITLVSLLTTHAQQFTPHYLPSHLSFESERQGYDDLSSSLSSSLSHSYPNVAKALQRGVELLLSDFIEPWYKLTSNNTDFMNDLRELCDEIFNRFAQRALKVDWTQFLVRQVVNQLIFLVKIYRLTERHLNKTDFFFANPNTPSHLKRKLIYSEIVQTYRLHPGIADADKYLRRVSAALISRLVPSNELKSAVFRHLMREMMLSYCLKVGMSFCEPHWINVSFVSLLNKMKIEQERAPLPTIRLPTALETHARNKRNNERSTTSIATRKDLSELETDQKTTINKEKQPDENEDKEKNKEDNLLSSSFLTNTPSSPPLYSDHSPYTTQSPYSSAPSSPLHNRHVHHQGQATETAIHTLDHNPPASMGEIRGETPQLPYPEGIPEKEFSLSHPHEPASMTEKVKFAPTAIATSNADLNAALKETLVLMKMQQWEEEREKRQQATLLSSSLSFDSLNEQKKTNAQGKAARISVQTGPVSQLSGLTPSSHSHSNHLVPSFLSSRKERPAVLTLPAIFRPNFDAVPLSSITSNWWVAIATASIRFDPKPYAAYQLDIKNGSTVSLLTWTLEKRYNQFEDLHFKLKKAMPASFDAQLPKKHFFGNLDQEFIRQRKKELEKYLGQLLWNQHVLKSEELREFLLPTEREIKEASKGHNASIASNMAGGNQQHGHIHPTSTSSSSSSSTPPSSNYSSSTRPPVISPVQSPIHASHSHPPMSSLPHPHSHNDAHVPLLSHATPQSTLIQASVVSAYTRNMTEESETHSQPMSLSTSARPSLLIATESSLSAGTTLPHQPRSPPPVLASVATPSNAWSTETPHAQAQVDSVQFSSPCQSPTQRVGSMATVAVDGGVSPVRSSSSPLCRSTSVMHSLIVDHFATPLLANQSDLGSTPTRANHEHSVKEPQSHPTSRSFSAARAADPSLRQRHSSRVRPDRMSHRSRKKLEREIGDNLYHLLEEVFDLNHSLLRRTVASTLKQSIKLVFKESINARVKDTISALVSEQSVIEHVEWLIDMIWPNGVFVGNKSPISDTVRSNTSQQASTLLLESVPALLTTVLGTQHCDQAIMRFFDFLQMQPLVQHLAYSVLDSFVIALFPELQEMTVSESKM